MANAYVEQVDHGGPLPEFVCIANQEVGGAEKKNSNLFLKDGHLTSQLFKHLEEVTSALLSPLTSTLNLTPQLNKEEERGFPPEP